MDNLVLGLLVQVFLAFGVAGLLWPDKLMSLFGILLFPWRASDRLIRAHGICRDRSLPVSSRQTASLWSL